MPYATLAEPPPELRARVLDAAVARAQPVAQARRRPAARPARRVVWSRFVGGGSRHGRARRSASTRGATRQELALQREMTVRAAGAERRALVRAGGDRGGERRGWPRRPRPRRQEGRRRAEGHAGAAGRAGLPPVGGGEGQERAVRPVHRRPQTGPCWRSSWSRSNRTPRPSASSSSPSSRRRSPDARRARG